MLKNIFTVEEFEDLKAKVSKEITSLPILYQKKIFELMGPIVVMVDHQDERMNALMLLTIALAFIDNANDQEKEKASTND